MGIAVAVMPEDGAPQVGVTVTGLDPGSLSVISVEVSWDTGLTWHAVRGAARVSVIGSVFVRDYVPALNTALTYRLVVHSGATTPTPTTATITVPSLVAWIQDPLYPAEAVAVDCLPGGTGPLVLSDSFAALTRVQEWDAALVIGTRTPVASVGMRQAPSKVALHLRTRTADQEATTRAVRLLFDLAGVLVLRGFPATIPLAPVTYAVAGDVVESPVLGGVLGLRNDWDVSLTAVGGTSNAVAVPWFTYDDVAALWVPDTYDAVAAARPGDTYLDWARDPRRP